MARKSDVSATRGVMNQRIGEILTAVIGDDRLQKLYEGRQVPPELAGKSSTEIVLTLKLVPPAVVTALLVAQAAERTFILAAKAQSIAKKIEIVRAKKEGSENNALERKEEGYVSETDALFKFVGSEKDADVLKAAQATWLVAQIYLNNEFNAFNERVTEPSGFGSYLSNGEKYADGFRAVAVQNYKKAAEALQREGYEEAAEKLERVAGSLARELKDAKAPRPVEFLTDHRRHVNWVRQQLDIMGGGNHYGFSQPEEDFADRLVGLMKLGDEPVPVALKARAAKPLTPGR